MTYNKPSAGIAAAVTPGVRHLLAALAFCIPQIPAGSAMAADVTESYAEHTVARGGAITGHVSAGQSAPKVRRYIVPKQADICGGNYRDSSLVSVEAGVLQDVIVYLDEVPAGKPFRAAAKKVTVNQIGCRFVPYLSVLMDGGELEAVNSDPLLHNIHIYELLSQGRRTTANVSQPRKGDIMTMSVHLNTGKALKIECDAHAFMHAYVFVARNPYYAIVRRDGTFEITDIPPGRYSVRTWHPYLGEKEQSIEIGPDVTANLDIEY